MATKKQKRAAGIAKREAFEAEQRERGLQFLKMSQEQRTEERKKAEEARKERAIAKSKRLAAQHKREKETNGVVKVYKPGGNVFPRPAFLTSEHENVQEA